MPIFQPGTVMFVSAVKKTSKKAKFDAEHCHMNGPILGPKDAIYLAKFASDLAHRYNEQCRKAGLDKAAFHRSVYLDSVESVIRQFEQDDKAVFGR